MLGILLVAPFVLDLEHGTYRLAWTQSVTRRRWLIVRLGLSAGGILIGSICLTVLMSWWNGPLDHIGSRLNPNQFDFEGIVPIAYGAFAAALCLAAGTILRRAVPAIGLTLAGYLALRVGVETWVRFHYLAPVTKRTKFGVDVGSLTRGDYFIRASASLPKAVMRACLDNPLPPPPSPGSPPAQRAQSCFAHHGVFTSVIYQPAGRFWLFQGIESGIFLGLAAMLTAVTVWWVLRRTA